MSCLNSVQSSKLFILNCPSYCAVIVNLCSSICDKIDKALYERYFSLLPQDGGAENLPKLLELASNLAVTIDDLDEDIIADCLKELQVREIDMNEIY